MIWGMTNKQKGETIYSQKKWFAWRPVKLKDGQWVWWEYVWIMSERNYWHSAYHYESI